MNQNEVNSTGGIMLQVVKPNCDATNRYWTPPSYKRSMARSLKVKL